MKIAFEKHGKLVEVEVDEEDWTRPIRICDLPWNLLKKEDGGHYVIATVLLHRAILDFPKGPVDHINRSGTDCRRENLRAVSTQENLWNRRLYRRADRRSQYRGVTFNKATNKWQAQIRTNEGRQKHIGSFDTEREAAIAWNAKCLELRGPEFAVLNVIDPDDPCDV